LALPQAVRLAMPVLVMVVLWLSSSKPPSSRAPSMLRALLHNGAHVVAYFGLAGAWMLALSSRSGARAGVPSRRIVLASLVLSIAYGVIDELHQSFVPGRHCSLWDIACDVCGSIIAVTLLLWTFGGEARFARITVVFAVAALVSVAAATWLPM